MKPDIHAIEQHLADYDSLSPFDCRGKVMPYVYARENMRGEFESHLRVLLAYVKELEAERDLLLGVASDEWYNNGNEGARRMLRDLNDLRIENKRPQLEEFGFLEPERSIYPYSGITNPNTT